MRCVVRGLVAGALLGCVLGCAAGNAPGTGADAGPDVAVADTGAIEADGRETDSDAVADAASDAVADAASDAADGHPDAADGHPDATDVPADAPDAALDIPPDAADAADVASDVADDGIGAEVALPGGPGWPCGDNDDCADGPCLETPDGERCARTCAPDAPCDEGYACRPVSASAGIVDACIHQAPRVCRPCRKTADCQALFVATPMACVELGGRSACLRACQADADCEAGATCRAPDGRDAPALVCVPESGQCGCTARWIATGVEGVCTRTNPVGTCFGAYTCTADGPSPCGAPEPAPEACNGHDDDCDGSTDEELGTTTCGLGDCATTVAACIGGVPQACVPEIASEEACNDRDDDCDGSTDEDLCDCHLDCDNCPGVCNPTQADADKDGLGDACDPDRDGDDVANEVDVCPDVADPGQYDVDQDGLGDACDCDIDGDGAPNDGFDATGGACPPCGGVGDPACDNCPYAWNPDQLDFDGNGLGDACDDLCDGPCADDNCPWIHNAWQNDMDFDGNGDACDCDIDGDGVPNNGPDASRGGTCPHCGGAGEPACDTCPVDPDPDQLDLNENGRGDACDCDIDGDGDGNCLGNEPDDCAPYDKYVFHGQREACNGYDDNCNGLVDEAGATGCTTYFYDEDRDGRGIEQQQCLCSPKGFYTALQGGDCDDLDPAIHPDATRRCNGKDNDCDGAVDSVPTAFADDFDAGSLAAWSPLAGTWQAGDGRLKGTGAGGDVGARIYTAQTFWGGVEIECDIAFDAGGGPQAAGVILDSTRDGLDEYRFDFRSATASGDANTLLLRRYVSGEPTDLGSGVASVPITNPVHLRVRRGGASISIAVNGTVVRDVIDPAPLPPGGRAGASVPGDGTAWYDDVVVRSCDQ